MEYRVTHLFTGGNDGWDAWATADTYLRYRSLIDAAPGRYAPTGLAANANSADGKYSLMELFKYVLTQSYYAPVDSTSNHYLENAAGCYLANVAFPGEVIKPFNNSTSDPTGSVQILSRAKGVATSGPGEFLSINYGVANWGEFLSIYQLTGSANAQIAATSKVAFETALAMNAGYWMNGQVAGPTGRGYPNTGAWGASEGDSLTWTYLGGDYGQAAQQLKYATSTDVKTFAVLAAEAGQTLAITGAPAAYIPPTSILTIDNTDNAARVIKSNFNNDYQYSYDAGQWSTYSDSFNWNAQGGAAWRNRTIWTKPENQSYNAVSWAINPGTNAAADANGNWTYVNPDTLQTYPLSGSGTYGGGSPFSAQVQNLNTILQGFNIPPRSAGITPGGSYVVRGALIYVPIPKVTATGQEAADGDGWVRPVISTDGYRLFVAYNSVFMCYISTAPISVGTKLGNLQFYNVYGGATPGQTVDPETYLQFAIAQETFSPSQFAGTTLAEKFANFQTVMNGRALPKKVNTTVDHPAWIYTDEKATLTAQYGSPARYARDAKTYTHGFGDDYIGDVTNANRQVIDYENWPMFQVADGTGKKIVDLPGAGRNMTVTVPGQSPTYYDFTNWKTSTGPDIGLKIGSNVGSQIRLDWNAGLGATTFKIERCIDGTNWTTLTSTLAGTSTGYTDTGLSQGTIYYYRVTPNGTALGTTYPVSTMVTYHAPSNLKLTLNSTSQITLTWTNSAATNDGVQLQYSVDGYSQWSWLVNLPASYVNRTVSYTDFTGGERLFYRAVAYSNNGPNVTDLYSVASNVVGTEFSTLYVGGTVSMPRFLKATTNTLGTQIALIWNDTAYNETAYRVDRSADGGATWTTLTNTLAANTTGYVDPNLVAGVAYTYRVSALNGAASSAYSLPASATAVAANATPTIAQVAAAPPGPVTGKSTTLTVLGADDAGEPNLKYFWSVTDGPGSVAFGNNYVNGAKNTVATFSRAGTYTLNVAVVDAQGLQTTSSVQVVVQQTLTGLSVAPAKRTIKTAGTLQLSAAQTDQFGMAMATPVALTWSSTAGTVSSAGLFTAPATPGLSVIIASGASMYATAEVAYQTQALTLAAYSFEDGSGTTAADSSGNGFDASLLGGVNFGAGVGVKGVAGGGLVFDGTGRAQIGDPTAMQFTGAITMSAWVKFNGSAGMQAIIEKGYNSSGTRGEVFLRINAGKYEVGSWNGSNNYTSVAIPAGDAGNWVHLLGTYDATAGKWVLFRNGLQLSSTSTATGAVLVTNRDWTIGATDIPDRYFTGSIDEVRISNTATSAADALALYNAYQGPTVATAATASAPNNGKSTLTVLGASPAGEATLKYTWAAVGNPPAPVTFSANGTNAAKSTVATFTATGTYNFVVTITDASGQAITSYVKVVVTDPAWLAPGSGAIWNPSAKVLTVTGPTGIIADPSGDLPTINATGAAAAVTFATSAGNKINLAGLSLSGGASATVVSLGTSRSQSRFRVLVIGVANSASAPTFAIDDSSNLDLTDNDLVVLYGGAVSPLASVRSSIASGYAGGTWAGKGISSSVDAGKSAYGLGYSEAAALGLTTFDGVTLGAQAVLVKYTLLGDTRLRGSVDATDLATVRGNVGKSGLGWLNGDFDYNGLVNSLDLNKVRMNYGLSAFTTP